MADLYSNCVILEFSAPITRAQLDQIRERVMFPRSLQSTLVDLPQLKEIVCAEREGNSVVPTIAADEC